MLTLDALAVLDAIDRRGSFGGAAEELRRVPSAITYAVQKLESELGFQIFDRGGHRARLTAAGQRLLADGRQLLRDAGQLEERVRRLQTGWELELRIAVGELISLELLYPLLRDFYREGHTTQLRIGREVLQGAWEALISGRADLIIGAAGEGPSGGGYTRRVLGAVGFVFVVAPDHPLADCPEPLREEEILCHRAVAAADTSRSLPPVTSALLRGQDVLTLPSLAEKCEAHRCGLGVGSVPRYLVREDLEAGRLVSKRVESALPHPQLSVAWRHGDMGKALRWFLRRLEDPSVFAGILGE